MEIVPGLKRLSLAIHSWMYVDIRPRQTWESGGVIPVLPRGNSLGYHPGLFYTGRVQIRFIVG